MPLFPQSCQSHAVRTSNISKSINSQHDAILKLVGSFWVIDRTSLLATKGVFFLCFVKIVLGSYIFPLNGWGKA